MSRRTISLLATAFGLLATTALPAAAGSDYVGGCSLTATADRVQNPFDGRGTWHAVFDIETALRSTDDPARPVSATVTCYLLIAGVEQPGTRVTASGTGVVAGVRHATFTTDRVHRSEVQLCQFVDFTSDATPSAQTCFEQTSVCHVDCWLVQPAIEFLCPIAGPVAPGDYGVARVEDDGDVYVDGLVAFSCWPFDDAR